MIYSSIIYFYSKNINDLRVQELLEVIDLPAYDLWVLFQSFMTLDPNLPRQLREHFHDIERQLVLHLIWQKDTAVVKKLEQVIEYNKIMEATEVQPD